MSAIDAPQEDSSAPTPAIATDLAISDLFAALKAGWADFVAMPRFGLFFGGVYVLAGLVIGYVSFIGEELTWLIPATAGFPLIAPFVAVGLYEASRRREASEPLRWAGVIGALKGHGDDQILSMGVIVFVAFGFWMIVAHAVFAIFMSESGVSAHGGWDMVEALLTPAGLAMLGVGGAIGAIMAYAFYAMTVISLPMLVERKVDFLTAIISSFKTLKNNGFVMFAWAAIIAVVLAIAMLPAFLGLFIALPVLGHATWHLYRRVTR
ncbi:MAG: DUF2189 domain-containing protein [Erythrobacter sp.]|uniref:DUF2189 domain-containing protein n=1 Tax=Erythrobacter sp. TaxID=1042 RepID=UPI002615CE01|nr:DUF2189 domain-containing protein [Erythrobacter sp.]MDJ0977468.1 DUF2189 domain-containing protein [Erythrobacter sp.]